jgi:hypothetical protein
MCGLLALFLLGFPLATIYTYWAFRSESAEGGREKGREGGGEEGLEIGW